MVGYENMYDKNQFKTGWRIPLSIICSIGWLIFIIVWLAFFAGDYSGNQNFAIILASILVVFLFIGGPWAIWGLRMVPKEGWEMMKVTGFKWRILISVILPFVALIFMIYWFYFQADLFNIYQNIAIFFVTILVMGAILGVIWSYWKASHSDMSKHFEVLGKEIGEEIEKSFKGKDED